MLAPDELLKVAIAYSEATGLSLSRISRLISGNNDKCFIRLARGQGMNARTAIRVEEALRANWPANATWPAGVPGKPRTTVPAVISRRLRNKSAAAE